VDGFVNRDRELAELDAAARAGGLLVVFGRRRVGKSRLLRQWLHAHGGLYSQAIEGATDLQIDQIFQDVRARLATALVPRSWAELLEILSLQPPGWTLCLDELPYLVASDPTLPSRLQRFLDHQLPPRCLVILAGSSTSMMHELFLGREAPLNGRARKLLHVQPMEYTDFCRARRLDAIDLQSFEKFARVGGIPKYWEFVEPTADVVSLVDELFFGFAPYMEHEPQRLLRDEGMTGTGALAVLEAVGRGAERPSEIASRLATRQTNLSRQLQQLLDASVLLRELPYGENLRTTKRVLYRIHDPALRFWFRVFSPHRSRWATYTLPEKRRLVHEHAASVFEDFCRARVPGAGRYWEGGVEVDLVAPDPQVADGLLVAEVKYRLLSTRQRRQILEALAAKWASATLSARHPRVRFEVFDASVLEKTRPERTRRR
jgi:AAA+ ATPase superfamily predicted ATPase